MPVLKPCNHCRHRGNCETHAAKLKALRGTGITAAQFRCHTHTSEFYPGLVVEAKIANATTGHGPYGESTQWEATLSGTVMRWVGAKVLVCIDDGQEDGKTECAVVKLWPERLTPANVVVAVCEACGLPVGRKLDKWGCEICHPENVDESGLWVATD
jgi:hypothetical protein